VEEHAVTDEPASSKHEWPSVDPTPEFGGAESTAPQAEPAPDFGGAPDCTIPQDSDGGPSPGDAGGERGDEERT
jgi:hypothetical protein